MAIEVLTILAILVGGSALVRIAGLRGWGLPLLGSIVGISLYIGIGSLQVLLPITSSPALTISLTVGLPVAGLLWSHLRGTDVRIQALPAIAFGVGVVGLIAIIRSARLVAWSNDTFRYLLNASLIATDSFDFASTALVPKRLIGIPLLHAPSNLNGEHYLQSLTPLIAGLVLATIAWLAWNGLCRNRHPRTIAIVIAAGLLVLATTNRYIFHAFYVNGHLLVGLLLLAVVGCGWITAVNDQVSRRAMLLVMGGAVVALVFVRAEAALLAGLALLPTLLDGETSRRAKAAFLVLLGIPLIAWQSFVAGVYLEEGLSVPLSVLGLFAGGIIMLAAIPLLRWGGLSNWRRLILWLVEIGLWSALLMLALRKPELLKDSLSATVQNGLFGAGSWGLSLLLLIALTVTAAFLQVPAAQRLRFPLTSFIPFAFLLAYLRDAAYRVGDGDSLNRMWIQLIPVAVLYVTVAFAGGEWRLRRVRDEFPVDAPPHILTHGSDLVPTPTAGRPTE